MAPLCCRCVSEMLPRCPTDALTLPRRRGHALQMLWTCSCARRLVALRFQLRHRSNGCPSSPKACLLRLVNPPDAEGVLGAFSPSKVALAPQDPGECCSMAGRECARQWERMQRTAHSLPGSSPHEGSSQRLSAQSFLSALLDAGWKFGNLLRGLISRD